MNPYPVEPCYIKITDHTLTILPKKIKMFDLKS